MKTLKTLSPALLLVVILFISGCDKKDGKACGDESTERVSSFGNVDADKFAQYLTPEQLPYVRYQTLYVENYGGLGFSFFVLMNTLNGVCPYEPIQLYTNLELVAPNAAIKDSIAAESINNSFDQSVLGANGVYEATEYFDTKEEETTSPKFAHGAYIPYQGSRAADSLYFWSQVVSFELATGFKINQ